MSFLAHTRCVMRYNSRTNVKVYTKTGDAGTTSLFGGRRVDKDSLRIDAYGNVDELNSLIGITIADINDWSLRAQRSNLSSRHPELVSGPKESSPPFDFAQGRTISKHVVLASSRTISKHVVLASSRTIKVLTRIQEELMVLGSDLASPLDVKVKTTRVSKAFVSRLEKEIDAWDKNLPKLKNFILPGGGKTGANLHLARTVARRVERSVVALAKEEKINKYAVVYINRLSDWLFVLARYVNRLENQKESIWRGRF